MAVFEYTATAVDQNEYFERGVVVAQDRLEAYDKIRRNSLSPISLKQLEGLQAFLSRRTADIR